MTELDQVEEELVKSHGQLLNYPEMDHWYARFSYELPERDDEDLREVYDSWESSNVEQPALEQDAHFRPDGTLSSGVRVAEMKGSDAYEVLKSAQRYLEELEVEEVDGLRLEFDGEITIEELWAVSAKLLHRLRVKG